jgi:hypothetical protein
MTDRPSAPQPVAEIVGGVLRWHVPEPDYKLAQHYLRGTHHLFDQAALDAAVAAARGEERRQWITAIDEAMVCSHIGVFNDGDDPRAALNKVLAWHQTVALDPAVSSDAQALIECGRAEERERCARICESVYPEWNPEDGHCERPCFDTPAECAAAIRAATPQEPT